MDGYYLLLVQLIIWGFAIYDVLKRRVPDMALVFFIPVALMSPFLQAIFHNCGIAGWGDFASFLLGSALGAAAGFGVLLLAALLSKGGSGVGGGDIKLAAMIGFIYGPYGIITVLLIASLLALPSGLFRKKVSFSLPFVPFMAVGSLAVTAFSLLK